MTKSKKEKVIRLLREVEKNWPDDWMLFANAGTLQLVRTASFDEGKIDVLEEFSMTCCGGDWGD